jgi:hypothetical protein
VVLDAGFDSGDTLRRLQRRKLAYTVPLRRKGKGGNRRNAVWGLDAGTVTTVAWATDQGGRPVRTRAVVVRRRKEKDKKVYAFGGWVRPGRGRRRGARAWRGGGTASGSGSRRATGS